MTAGGKLSLAGAAVAAAGAGLLLARGELPSGLREVERNPHAGLLLAGTVILALGCALYVLQPSFDRELARQLPFATIRTSLAMLAVAVAAANVLALPVVLLHAGPGGASSLGALGLTFLIVTSELPIAGVVALRLVLPGCLSWRDLGLRARPVGEHVVRGLTGGVGLFLTAAVVGLLLTRLGVRQNQFERFEGIQGAPLGLFLLAALAGCAVAPLAEELFFRGYVFHTFRQRYGAPWAYLYSAGLFAAVHANLAAAAPIFVLGLLLAYIFETSGSILPGAIAHGVNNAISFWLLYSGFRG
jgi:membrane protease YdiL (CAAX protease family)